MSTWYYYDNDGQKQGPFTGEQIKNFAKQGTITPETMIENMEGKSIPAHTAKGLTFPETTSSKPIHRLTEQRVDAIQRLSDPPVYQKKVPMLVPMFGIPAIGCLGFCLIVAPPIFSFILLFTAPYHDFASGYSLQKFILLYIVPSIAISTVGTLVFLVESAYETRCPLCGRYWAINSDTVRRILFAYDAPDSRQCQCRCKHCKNVWVYEFVRKVS